MDPKYGGTRVIIAGEEFWVPGLSLRHMRALTESGRIEKLTKITGMPTAEEQALVLDTIYEAVRENHPSVSRDFLDEAISSADSVVLLKLIFSSSRVRVLPNVTSP
ncbi:MAG: hypothetical protein WCS72_12180 [Deltaproteobacteria bacterium]